MVKRPVTDLPPVSGGQVELRFEAGLTEQFPEFMDCVRAAVHGCGRPFKHVAADLDMRVSELSRKLAENPQDPVHFPLRRLPDLIRATNDLRPLYWLIERFLEAPTEGNARVVASMQQQLAAMQHQLAQLVAGPVRR